MSQIVANRIRTPDGTVLTSYHRHDYKTHVDAVTGEEYMTDGGTAYIRRNINRVPAEDLTVTTDDPFEVQREAFCWGTRGRDGRQPLTWRPLCELDQDHIRAILETQDHIEPWTRRLFETELEYRKEQL